MDGPTYSRALEHTSLLTSNKSVFILVVLTAGPATSKLSRIPRYLKLKTISLGLLFSHLLSVISISRNFELFSFPLLVPQGKIQLYYMASSVSGQDEPNRALSIGYPSGQDGAILPARDYPPCPARTISPKAIQ